jgi:hypothetical protein
MKVIFAFSMGLLLLNFQAKSQEYVEVNNGKFPIPTSSTEIIMQPLSVIGGGFEVGLERKFNMNSAFRFIAGLYGTESPTAYSNATSFSGFKIDAHYKLILDNKSHKSGYSEYYLGIFSTYRSITVYEDEQIFSPSGNPLTQERKYEGSAAAFGVMLGTKATLFKRMNVDVYAGIGYMQRLGDKDDATKVHIPM